MDMVADEYISPDARRSGVGFQPGSGADQVQRDSDVGSSDGEVVFLKRSLTARRFRLLL